jgi:hypothetical protein
MTGPAALGPNPALLVESGGQIVSILKNPLAAKIYAHRTPWRMMLQK